MVLSSSAPRFLLRPKSLSPGESPPDQRSSSSNSPVQGEAAGLGNAHVKRPERPQGLVVHFLPQSSFRSNMPKTNVVLRRGIVCAVAMMILRRKNDCFWNGIGTSGLVGPFVVFVSCGPGPSEAYDPGYFKLRTHPTRNADATNNVSPAFPTSKELSHDSVSLRTCDDSSAVWRGES
jgi:hypothetical protein